MIALRNLHLSHLPLFSWPQSIPVMSVLYHLSFDCSTPCAPTILEFLCQSREIFPSLASLTLSECLGYSWEGHFPISDSGSHTVLPSESERKSSIFPQLKHLTFSCLQTEVPARAALDRAYQEHQKRPRYLFERLLIDAMKSCVSLESVTISLHYSCTKLNVPYVGAELDSFPAPMPCSQILSAIPPSVTCLNILGNYPATEGIMILGIDERDIIMETFRYEYRHPCRQLQFFYYPKSREEPSITTLDQIFKLPTVNKRLGYHRFSHEGKIDYEAGDWVPLAFDCVAESRGTTWFSKSLMHLHLR